MDELREVVDANPRRMAAEIWSALAAIRPLREPNPPPRRYEVADRRVAEITKADLEQAVAAAIAKIRE